MSAREDILARLGTSVTSPESDYLAITRGYLTRHHEGDIRDLLAERVADYRAVVHRVSPEDLPRALAGAMREGRYVIPAGLPDAWAAEIATGLQAGEDTDLAEVAGVITGCAVAIAETGTIVLDHRPGQGRRALTLVPDHHLVVVRADQIAADVPEALALLDITRPLTFISGPSATSDIELSRVEGVHGPRTLEVFLT
jgi:L-lactate dehydrogenase complex protein LldG